MEHGVYVDIKSVPDKCMCLSFEIMSPTVPTNSKILEPSIDVVTLRRRMTYRQVTFKSRRIGDTREQNDMPDGERISDSNDIRVLVAFNHHTDHQHVRPYYSRA